MIGRIPCVRFREPLITGGRKEGDQRGRVSVHKTHTENTQHTKHLALTHTTDKLY